MCDVSVCSARRVDSLSCVTCLFAVFAVWTLCGSAQVNAESCSCGSSSCASVCVASCQADCASCCRCCIYFEPRLGKRNSDVISSVSPVANAARKARYHGLLRDAESYYFRTLLRRRRRIRGKLQMSLRALNAKMAALRSVENARNHPTVPAS